MKARASRQLLTSLVCVLAAAVPGCGDSTAATDAAPADRPRADLPSRNAADALPADAGTDPQDTGDTGGTGDPGDAADPAADAPYPAFMPPLATVADLGGPVLALPRIVPVFLTDGDAGPYPFETELRDFLTRYMASPEWLAQVAEYGVGAGTVAPSAHSDGTGLPAMTDDNHLQTWAQGQVQAGAWGAPNGSDVYVLFLDAARQVTLGTGLLCRGTGGYHGDLLLSGRRLAAFAVIPNCRDNLDVLTRTTSHELTEAVTDPYVNSNPAFERPSSTTPPDGAWALAYTGGEVGDMCEQRSDAAYVAMDIGHAIQRTWFNLAALAYTDPCVPVPAGAVYFNSAPVLPETVHLLSRGGSRMLAARGITIPAGSQATVDVQLFSTGPTSGPWRVVAQEALFGTTAAALRFAWDHTTGRNGDVLHLTITARTAAPEGRTFVVRFTLGAANSTWVGAVVAP